jgi:lipoate-protein ligase A
LNIRLTSEELNPMEINVATQLAKLKYETDEWNFNVKRDA